MVKHSNSLRQMDIMDESYINGVKIYPIFILDDCSRKILASHLYIRERAKKVVKTLKIAIEQYGSPKQIYNEGSTSSGVYTKGNTGTLRRES